MTGRDEDVVQAIADAVFPHAGGDPDVAKAAYDAAVEAGMVPPAEVKRLREVESVARSMLDAFNTAGPPYLPGEQRLRELLAGS